MNKEQAERELKSYSKLRRKCIQYEERIEQLHEKITSAGGQKISGMPSSQGKVTDLSNYIVEKEKLEEKKEIAESKVSAIETKIALMDDAVLSDILKKRYIQEKCWTEIANDYRKSESWAKHRNGPAIKAYIDCTNLHKLAHKNTIKCDII